MTFNLASLAALLAGAGSLLAATGSFHFSNSIQPGFLDAWLGDSDSAAPALADLDADRGSQQAEAK